MLNKSLSGIGWVTGFSLAQLVANVLLTMILARLLSPEEFGSYALCLVIISFLQIFAQMGTGAAVIQAQDANNEFLSSGLSITLIASITVTILTVIAVLLYDLTIYAPTPDGPNIHLYTGIMALALPVITLAEYLQSLLNKRLLFKVPAGVNFVCYISGFVVPSLFLAMYGKGVLALILAYVIQHTLRAIMLLATLRDRPSLSLNAADTRRILRYGIGFSIAKIGNAGALQADNIIVASTLGNAALGIYSRSYQIIMSPVSLFAVAVDRVLFPVISIRQTQVAALKKMFLSTNCLIFMSFLPISMILFEYRHQLVNLVFGRSWAAASDPFGILALALPFRASYRLSDIVARARGYVYRRAVAQGFYAASIVVLGLVGSIWDVAGVALGVTLAVAVNWSMMTILTMRSLKIGTLELIYSLRPAAFTLSVCYLMIVIICLSGNQVMPFNTSMVVGSYCSFISALLVMFTATSTLRTLRVWVRFYRAARHGS